MIANEIGNDFQDYNQRTEKALAFLYKGMVKEAIDELNNRQMLVFNAYNEASPNLYCFAVAVKRIDSTMYEDFAPDSLEQIIEHLDRIGLTNNDALLKLKEIKKKIDTELGVYFPKFFGKVSNKEFTALRYKRAFAKLDAVIERDKDFSEEQYSIEKQMLEKDKPNIWNVHIKGNMERALEVDFQKFVIDVMGPSAKDIKEVMTFEFYSRVENLTEKKQKQKPK